MNTDKGGEHRKAERWRQKNKEGLWIPFFSPSCCLSSLRALGVSVVQFPSALQHGSTRLKTERHEFHEFARIEVNEFVPIREIRVVSLSVFVRG